MFPWIQILLISFLVAIPYQIYLDYSENQIEIDFYRRFVQPPFECGPQSKKIGEITWIEWAGHSLWKDRNKVECMEHVKKLAQSPWPNLFTSIKTVLIEVCETPILILFSGVANGISPIYAKSFLACIVVCCFTIALLLVFSKYQPQQQVHQHQQPPSYETQKQRPWYQTAYQTAEEELRNIFKEEPEITEQFMPTTIDPELKNLLNIDSLNNSKQLLDEEITY